jgi:hypothetical protein
VKSSSTFIATVIAIVGLQAFAAGSDQSNSGNGAPVQVSADQCNKIVKQAIPLADKCLAVSDYTKRAACTDSIGKTLNVGDDVMQACKQYIDPVQQQYVAKEQSKYPKQDSAFSDHGGDQGGGNMGNNQGGGNMGNNQGGGNMGNNQGGGNMGNNQGGGNMGNNQGGGNMGNNQGGGNMGNNQGGGNMGNNQGGKQAVNVSADQCNKIVKQAIPLADKCLAISDFTKRAACTDNIGKTLNVGDDVMTACHQYIDPVQQQYMAKEQAKYPKQASAFAPNKDGNGGQQGSDKAGNSGGGNVDCTGFIGKVRTSAVACLAKSARPDRKKCFDGVGKTINASPSHDSCQGPLDQLKSDMMTQEQQKYPDQQSALNN